MARSKQEMAHAKLFICSYVDFPAKVIFVQIVIWEQICLNKQLATNTLVTNGTYYLYMGDLYVALDNTFPDFCPQ